MVCVCVVRVSEGGRRRKGRGESVCLRVWCVGGVGREGGFRVCRVILTNLHKLIRDYQHYTH